MKKLLISATLSVAALSATAGVNSPGSEGYCERGILMYHDNNFVGCIDQLRFYKQSLPEGTPAEEADFYLAMAAAHLGKAEAPSLLRFFQWRYPASPLCVEAVMTLAAIEQDGGNYAAALREYESLEETALDRDMVRELQFNKAVCYIKTGRLSEAEPLLNKLGASGRYSNDATFYKGYIAYARQDFNAAEKLFKSVNTSQAPANMADFYLTQIYFNKGNYDKALASARKLRKSSMLDSEFITEATRIAGESAYHLGDDNESVQLLRQYMSETDSPQPSALYILGLDYYHQADYDKAIEYLSPVSSLDNAMGQSAALYLGQALMHVGDYSTALVPLQNALKMDFDSDAKETAYYNYAVAQTKGGKQPFGNSVATFEAFLKQYPDSRFAPEIREYIVTGYMNDNNYQAALDFIDKIKNPSDKILKAKQHALYTMGTRQLTSGHADQAVKTLGQAAKLRKYDPAIGAETDLWLGEAYYQENRLPEAIGSYDSYLLNAPKNAANRPMAVYGLGYAHFNNEDYSAAITNFQNFVNDRSVTDRQRLADAYNRLGDSYFMISQLDKANEAYLNSASANHRTADYPLFQQAVIKSVKGQYPAEIELLKSLIRDYPSSNLRPSAMLNMARAYAYNDEADNSINEYKALISGYPESAQARTAQLELARIHLNNNRDNEAIDLYKELITRYPTSEEGRLAATSLSNIMTDKGQFDQYLAFIESIPGAKTPEASEADERYYVSALNEYNANGTTSMLIDYLDKFPHGVYRPEALVILMESGRTSGNHEKVIIYAEEIVEKFPGNEHFIEVLSSKADAEYAIGKGQAALDSYTRLEQAASTPSDVNRARIGIIRAARELNLDNEVIRAAQDLLASASVTPEQRSEASFAVALAHSLQGNDAEAVNLWRELAKTPDNVYGSKAVVYLAQLEYDNGDYKAAMKDINDLFDARSPHVYWVARAYIIKSDIYRQQGNTSLADQMLNDLQNNYTGTEIDIFKMIDERLN